MRHVTFFALWVLFSVGAVRAEGVLLKPEVQREIDAFWEKDCLAWNIYNEARGESLIGQLAVAAVTLQRVREKRWPGGVCQVVYQPYQFSWTLQPQRLDDPQAWETALQVAAEALRGDTFLYREVEKLLAGANHYHRFDIGPSWNQRMTQVVRIGAHVFFRG